MAASPDIALADELAAVLNGQVWNPTFTAESVYIPDWEERKELKALTACTFPAGVTAEIRERVSLRKEVTVGIGFGKVLAEKTKAELDALCDVVRSVTNWLELQGITLPNPDGREFEFLSWEDRVRFDPDHITRTKQGDGSTIYSGTFLAVVAFTYELRA